MAKLCTTCREKAKVRCDRCHNEYCLDHAIKCPSCGTITCIRDLGKKRKCPICSHSLDICPECLMNGKIVRTLKNTNYCPECGWST